MEQQGPLVKIALLESILEIESTQFALIFEDTRHYFLPESDSVDVWVNWLRPLVSRAEEKKRVQKQPTISPMVRDIDIL